MNSRRWMMIVAACALIATGVCADEADLKKTFEALLPGMGQEQAQQKWQEICWNAGAPGHEPERSQACKLMAEQLGPGTLRTHPGLAAQAARANRPLRMRRQGRRGGVRQ